MEILAKEPYRLSVMFLCLPAVFSMHSQSEHGDLDSQGQAWMGIYGRVCRQTRFNPNLERALDPYQSSRNRKRSLTKKKKSTRCQKNQLQYQHVGGEPWAVSSAMKMLISYFTKFDHQIIVSVK